MTPEQIREIRHNSDFNAATCAIVIALLLAVGFALTRQEMKSIKTAIAAPCVEREK